MNELNGTFSLADEIGMESRPRNFQTNSSSIFGEVVCFRMNTDEYYTPNSATNREI